MGGKGSGNNKRGNRTKGRWKKIQGYDRREKVRIKMNVEMKEEAQRRWKKGCII